MQHKTTQILDFSRIRAGRAGYHFEEVELGPLVGRCFEGLELLAERQGVDLVAPDLPPGLLVRGDSDRLHQVFSSLVSNAVKYNRRGGRVWSEAAVGEDNDKGGKVVTVTVCDSGLGISGDDLPRIFEKYERVHLGVNPDLPGTGLGLAIARLIVLDHRGELSVQSTPGQGSRFTVRLPEYGRRDDATA
jgi:signal transduction histidine kinase